MDEVERITDPSLLHDFDVRTRLSSLNIETSEPSFKSTSEMQHVKLVLLQPLANADMLEACRNPDSRLLRKPDGFVCGNLNFEYLNIRPLGIAWRQALMKVPPICRLTFDFALPKENEESKGSFQKVYWDTDMPKDEGISVIVQHVMNLAITIATGTRMRADGAVQFEVVYDETEGVSLRAMALLKKQLRVLSETQAPRVQDGEQDTK